MKTSVRIILISLILLTYKNIFSQTILPHSIKGELVLEKSGNPYIADWDIVVEPRAQLIIMPGVEINVCATMAIDFSPLAVV